MSKRINVTVPDDLAERIEALDLSPSKLLQQAVSEEVDRRARLSRADMADLEVRLENPERHGGYSAVFTGRWLVAPDPESEEAVGVALSDGGKIVVYSRERAGGDWRADLEVFKDLKAAKRKLPADIHRDAQGALTGRVRLDI